VTAYYGNVFSYFQSNRTYVKYKTALAQRNGQSPRLVGYSGNVATCSDLSPTHPDCSGILTYQLFSDWIYPDGHEASITLLNDSGLMPRFDQGNSYPVVADVSESDDAPIPSNINRV
jgi:hypothetical protein